MCRLKKKRTKYCNTVISIVNVLLFAVCLVLIAVKFPAKCELNYSVIVGILSLLVTVLIGWNIYNAIDITKNVNNLEKEIKQQCFSVESKFSLNMMYAFIHLRGSLMENDNSKEYHIVYLNYCIVSYGLQELLYSQESKMKDYEDNVLDIVLKFLKNETMIVTPVQFHELLDVFHKLNISDKNKSKELYGLLTSINVSVQSE